MKYLYTRIFKFKRSFKREREREWFNIKNINNNIDYFQKLKY